MSASAPVLVITGSGTVVTMGAVPVIYPEPLVVPLLGRSISDAGPAKILKLATDLDLLGQKTDFTASRQIPGDVAARIGIPVDGRLLTLTAPSVAPGCAAGQACNPVPGTPEAFGLLWSRLLGLSSWLAEDLGPEGDYPPVACSVLTDTAPVPDPAIGTNIAHWPLSTPMASFRVLITNGTARCGPATGADVEVLRAAFAKGNQLTQWAASPTASETYGLTVRSLTPGEDACRGIFGTG